MKILHQITKGETISSIAKQYDCNENELIKVNDLTSYNISNLSSLVIPHNNNDFAVIKNLDKEILVEVTEDNLETMAELTKTKSYISSCTSVANLQSGDKIIFNKSKQCHTVLPLQTLSFIAKRLNVSEDFLIEKNNLKSNKLFIGQKIYY